MRGKWHLPMIDLHNRITISGAMPAMHLYPYARGLFILTPSTLFTCWQKFDPGFDQRLLDRCNGA